MFSPIPPSYAWRRESFPLSLIFPPPAELPTESTIAEELTFPDLSTACLLFSPFSHLNIVFHQSALSIHRQISVVLVQVFYRFMWISFRYSIWRRCRCRALRFEDLYLQDNLVTISTIVVRRDRFTGHHRLHADYFCDNLVFGSDLFCRWFIFIYPLYCNSYSDDYHCTDFCF
jgi:hypothetical protein